jgi:hypothetical protein
MKLMEYNSISVLHTGTAMTRNQGLPELWSTIPFRIHKTFQGVYWKNELWWMFNLPVLF